MIVYETLWLGAVSMVLALLVHEGGHLLGALAAGVAPRVLALGVGPVVCRLRRGGFTVVFRAVPVTGYVFAEPSGRFWAYFALVAAGPLASLLALAACLWAAAVWPDAVTPSCLAVGQGAFAGGTLFPSRGRIGGFAASSDGLKLYGLLRARRVPSLSALLAPLAVPLLPAGAPPPAPTRHTAALLFALQRVDQLVDPWARGEAVAALRALLTRPGLAPVERAVILSQLCAYLFLYDEGLGTPAEAEAWSRSLLDLSGEPAALDARGAALLLAGRVAEAERLLRAALGGYVARREADGLGAVLCRGVLARALAAAGRSDAAQALWREVESAPAIAASPPLRALVTRMKCRALPAAPASLPEG